MNNKRLAIEALVVLVLVGIVFGVWWWQKRQATQRVEEVQQEMQAQIEDVRSRAQQHAEALARSEAEAVFRAFAGGIAPSVLAGRPDDLDQAVGGLLDLPGIIFVHVIDEDGSVLATSDRKLRALENATEYAQWALQTSRLTTRQSEREGLLELAAPVVGPAGPAGYLWIGYDTGRVLEATRPADVPES